MPEGKWRIGYRTLCEYLLINFPGLLRLGEIIKEVSPCKFLARYSGDVDQRLIHIRDLTFGADGHQWVKARFNKTK